MDKSLPIFVKSFLSLFWGIAICILFYNVKFGLPSYYQRSIKEQSSCAIPAEDSVDCHSYNQRLIQKINSVLQKEREGENCAHQLFPTHRRKTPFLKQEYSYVERQGSQKTTQETFTISGCLEGAKGTFYLVDHVDEMKGIMLEKETLLSNFSKLNIEELRDDKKSLKGTRND
ncbi:hypothetical protein RBH88_06270 [Aminobacterium sp. MB27-C1]|uniref:hypothetical protein n=1 Tax=Aminobacterium sp. MB27-C1 TaxID=3070661 RepID=UPI0027DB7A71|nr:hypothetical protein [Aminobacterium sp. MB27-C1]WMI70475.1 hypothetical protein RBH88_06270 [Aminobacterium sp. MB27-C1]